MKKAIEVSIDRDKGREKLRDAGTSDFLTLALTNKGLTRWFIARGIIG